MSRRSRMRPFFLSGVVVASMLLGAILATRFDQQEAPPETIADATGIQSTATPAPVPIRVVPSNPALPNLPDLVEQVTSSVVLIEAGNGSALNPGIGAGVAVDHEGHILTNFHVIEGATSLVVRLQDGTAGHASVVGVDPSSDLAVIRTDIEPQRLSPAVFGDSSAVRVGDPVFAIGNPFKQEFSVTAGIISAVNRVTRSSFTQRSIVGVLQTDAALNPGNSGGPLFNAAGEVIGLNTSIQNPNGLSNAGIGFAIPSNTAVRYLPRLLAGETIRHPKLGIGGETLDELRAGELGVAVARGVYISEVEANSAADEAGLRGGSAGGDVVVAIDGEPVETYEDLVLLVDSRDVGETIALGVVRGTERLELKAVLRSWGP